MRLLVSVFIPSIGKSRTPWSRARAGPLYRPDPLQAGTSGVVRRAGSPPRRGPPACRAWWGLTGGEGPGRPWMDGLSPGQCRSLWEVVAAWRPQAPHPSGYRCRSVLGARLTRASGVAWPRLPACAVPPESRAPRPFFGFPIPDPAPAPSPRWPGFRLKSPVRPRASGWLRAPDLHSSRPKCSARVWQE